MTSGTTGNLTVPMMGSFFRNQTFPDNWYRRTSPGTFANVSVDSNAMFVANPVAPGANNASGAFVLDPPDGVSS